MALWTLVVSYGTYVTLWTLLVVSYAAYNNFVDVSRPLRGLLNVLDVSRLSRRFDSLRAYYSPNVKRVVASGLKAMMAIQCRRVWEKMGPSTCLKSRGKVVVV